MKNNWFLCEKIGILLIFLYLCSMVISIREFGRTELAQLYFPTLTASSAWRKLKGWIHLNCNLEAKLQELNYRDTTRSFTPRMVACIFEELGEPWGVFWVKNVFICAKSSILRPKWATISRFWSHFSVLSRRAVIPNVSWQKYKMYWYSACYTHHHESIFPTSHFPTSHFGIGESEREESIFIYIIIYI